MSQRQQPRVKELQVCSSTAAEEVVHACMAGGSTVGYISCVDLGSANHRHLEVFAAMYIASGKMV